MFFFHCFNQIWVKVTICFDKISLNYVNKIKTNYIISDRYKFKINRKICKKFYLNIINLHPSYLPFCKGSASIFFSVYYKKPIGISIHYVNANWDDGPVLLQKKIHTKDNDSLQDLYKKIRKEFKILIKENWLNIKKKIIVARRQPDVIKELYTAEQFRKIFLRHNFIFEKKKK